MTLVKFSINFCLLWWQSSLCISEVNLIQNSSIIRDVDKSLHLPQIGKSSEKKTNKKIVNIKNHKRKKKQWRDENEEFKTRQSYATPTNVHLIPVMILHSINQSIIKFWGQIQRTISYRWHIDWKQEKKIVSKQYCRGSFLLYKAVKPQWYTVHLLSNKRWTRVRFVERLLHLAEYSFNFCWAHNCAF